MALSPACTTPQKCTYITGGLLRPWYFDAFRWVNEHCGPRQHINCSKFITLVEQNGAQPSNFTNCIWLPLLGPQAPPKNNPFNLCPHPGTFISWKIIMHPSPLMGISIGHKPYYKRTCIHMVEELSNTAETGNRLRAKLCTNNSDVILICIELLERSSTAFTQGVHAKYKSWREKNSWIRRKDRNIFSCFSIWIRLSTNCLMPDGH